MQAEPAICRQPRGFCAMLRPPPISLTLQPRATESRPMSPTATAVPPVSGNPVPLRVAVAAHQGPKLGHSLWQVANSFLPFFGLCAAMYGSRALDLPSWTLLPLLLLDRKSVAGGKGGSVRVYLGG